ncbi:MAG: diacylglycerol kinase family lipid kinase [Chloroflexota bacterium]|nr:MAG: diacylglycerol kinase family lipid kinase [Chloroflexota bacterium]
MPKHNTKLIINPNADLGRAWRWGADLRSLVEEFGGADWSGTVYPTHATELARQAAEEGYKQVISVGGDGTTHEVINGLMQVPAESRPRLSIVPVGTGNDFASNIGVATDPAQAMRQAFTGKPKSIDIAQIESGIRKEFWDNTLGIGFDAKATIHSRNVPVLSGFLVYLIAAIKTIMLNHDPAIIQFESDQESWQEKNLLIVLCNGPREGGGFHIAPEALVDDGWLDYAAIKDVSRPMMFRLLPEVMNGTHGRFSQVRINKFRELKITSDRPLVIHTDGEIFAGFGTDVRELSVKVLPSALEVII